MMIEVLDTSVTFAAMLGVVINVRVAVLAVQFVVHRLESSGGDTTVPFLLHNRITGVDLGGEVPKVKHSNVQDQE